MAQYASSGSDAWDATIDVHNRPRWLKELAAEPGVAEVAPLTKEAEAHLDAFIANFGPEQGWRKNGQHNIGAIQLN